MALATKIDLDPKLAYGLYRFRLTLYGGETDSDPMIVIEGFRADRELTTIIPPVSSRGNSTFHNVKLTPKATEGLLAQLREQLQGS